MDISWLGHACVRLRALQTTVIMDPCDRSTGIDIGRPTADMVTVSSPHPLHAHTRGVRGDFATIDGPGEYEVKGVHIIGVATFLEPPAEGVPAKRNTAYVVEAEELRVAHLGGSAQRSPRTSPRRSRTSTC